MNLYCVRDSVADDFNQQIFCAKNDAVAVRMIGENAPFDGFELWFLGAFDLSSGAIKSAPKKIIDIPVKVKEVNECNMKK